MTADLSALLARGGWDLVDPRPVAAEHPDTFEMPSAGDLAGLRPGSLVRAMFEVVDIADVARDGLAPYDAAGRPVLVPHVERMWAVVTEVVGEAVVCVLDNQPYATHTHLQVHDRLELPLTHLIATDRPIPDLDGLLAVVNRLAGDDDRPHGPSTPVNPLAAPRIRADQQAICDRAGVRAEPPSLFGAALLARNVTPDVAVLHGARFDPDPARRDTGWVFFSGDDFEEVARTVGFDVVTLQQAHRAHPAIQPRWVLPVGWGFTLADGVDDLYPADISD